MGWALFVVAVVAMVIQRRRWKRLVGELLAALDAVHALAVSSTELAEQLRIERDQALLDRDEAEARLSQINSRVN